MRNLTWIMLFGSLCVSSASRAADDVAAAQRAVLDQALLLAGLQFARPPIVLTPVLPWPASRGAEAWTVYDEHNQADRIFVYTGSELFQCASRRPRPDWPCVLKLASILIHEAWHFRNGRDEVGAYDAQLAFLLQNGSDAVASGVRAARDRVRAAKQRASDAVILKLQQLEVVSLR